jgi:RES domain-containing protein
MDVYRLCREKHAPHLSGKGSAIKGGRWNSAGIELIYTSANRSLAMAEVMVHLTLGTLPNDFMMITINIPDDLPKLKISEQDLPMGWNSFPYLTATQNFGDKFISEFKFCLLQVPSAVTKGDYNFLINPYHPAFERIVIKAVEKFPFDRRIFL